MNGKVKIDKAQGEALARRTWETEFLTCLYHRSTRHVKKHQLFFTPNSLYTQIVLRWMPTPRETWTGSVPYVGEFMGKRQNVDVKRIALTVTAMIPARGCQRCFPPNHGTRTGRSIQRLRLQDGHHHAICKGCITHAVATVTRKVFMVRSMAIISTTVESNCIVYLY